MLAKQTYKPYKAQISNYLKGIFFEKLHKIIGKHDGKKYQGKNKEYWNYVNNSYIPPSKQIPWNYSMDLLPGKTHTKP
jgi:hypothetical protein